MLELRQQKVRMDSHEQESPVPFKEFELGEWFKPFEGYADLPYTFKHELHRAKEIHFIIRQLGEVRASLFWTEDDNSNIPVLIVLPTEERIVEGSEMKEWEEKLETRLMTMTVVSENSHYAGQTPPYKVEVILPSKNQVTGNFEIVSFEPPICENFSYSGIERQDILLPEIEEILELIQIRAVPD